MAASKTTRIAPQNLNSSLRLRKGRFLPPFYSHDARAHSKSPKPGRAFPVARPSRPPVHARASLPRTTAVPCPSVGRSGSPDVSRALSAQLTSAATGLARLQVLARRRHSLRVRGRLLWRVRDGWGRWRR